MHSRTVRRTRRTRRPGSFWCAPSRERRIMSAPAGNVRLHHQEQRLRIRSNPCLRKSGFWAFSPIRSSRRTADQPDGGHTPRADIPVQSAHVHHQGWHERVVHVTIGVRDGPLVRPACPLGYRCGENAGAGIGDAGRRAAGPRRLGLRLMPRRREPRVPTFGPGSLVVRDGLVSTSSGGRPPG